MNHPQEYYYAKAMLMGMRYDPDMHTLWRLGETGQYDADTMERMSVDDMRERIMKLTDIGAEEWGRKTVLGI